MADLDIHLSALDKCRTAIRTAAGQYKDTLREGNPGKLTYDEGDELRNNRAPVSADAFGDLTDSGTLAGTADTVWTTVFREMDEARRKLAGAEHGMSSVEENIRAAHKATS
ncbi:hypothetical protein ACTMTF_18980 [Nonomuraea sp. ZG12]|uniref:hypothetical protein n=1 Tax=Nonomuraea sp. ZG12 TaxID=3452207 RepID=UPI003F8A08B0